MRATISPVFTSSKMKIIFELVNDCAKNFTNYFVNKTKNIISVELNDVFVRYTSDVIAITTFGMSCDSLNDPKNDFYSMGEKAAASPVGIRTLLYAIVPALSKASYKFITTKHSQFNRRFFLVFTTKFVSCGSGRIFKESRNLRNRSA